MKNERVYEVGVFILLAICVALSFELHATRKVLSESERGNEFKQGIIAAHEKKIQTQLKLIESYRMRIVVLGG